MAKKARVYLDGSDFPVEVIIPPRASAAMAVSGVVDPPSRLQVERWREQLEQEMPELPFEEDS